MTGPRGESVEAVWRRYDAMEARLSAALSARMLELAGLAPGQRVLDLATGRGEPAIGAAQRVGPTGFVLGVDVNEGVLAMARERADAEGLGWLELRAGDAAALSGVDEASFDVVLVRWGLMYFARPVEALRLARRALKPGGVFVAAVWTEPERVPYFSLPRRVLERLAPVPPVDFDVPGTFFYADQARLERDLGLAGLRVAHVEELALPVMEADSDEAVIAWARAFGMTKLLQALPEATGRAWEADFAREAAALREADGFVRLGGVTRLVVARPA